MARYQLLKPSPLRIVRRQAHQQEHTFVVVARDVLEEETDTYSGSLDSSGGAVSPVEARSEGEESSESEDENEPPSPTESSASSLSQPPSPASPDSSTIAVSSRPAVTTASVPSVATSTAVSPTTTSSLEVDVATTSTRSTSTSTSSTSISSDTTTSTDGSAPSQPPLSPPPPPAFTQTRTSEGINAALPQITETPSPVTSEFPTFTDTATFQGFNSSSISSFTTTVRPTTSSPPTLISSRIKRPEPTTTSTSLGLPPQSAQSERAGDQEPQRMPRPEAPIMTRTAAVAATVLGILGALALLIGAVIFIKHRKRKRSKYNQPLSDDAFNPGNNSSLHFPETAHIDNYPGPRTNHMTRSTDRSNTLFGAASYSRPETVSTERSLPTANPFADPPLNKAYDVLAGRPRSTTLTDRGSWIRNPFRDPESSRFDPFGELKAKAQREKAKYGERVRREKEREVMRGYEEKERMGLEVPARKGSGVTVEGVGILDRTEGGMYR
ncbi:hypothetical protein ACN47E_007515 [Coniothyrium glycines]